MVVNFQSWLDPFIIITALPGALVGIVWTLFLWQTTFSVPSLMGAIMSIGVATANSILLVTFANEQRQRGQDRACEAALEAGRTRMRPVLMTALAMIIGMLPMSLGLGEGGEQNAPLGRAVIGGPDRGDGDDAAVRAGGLQPASPRKCRLSFRRVRNPGGHERFARGAGNSYVGNETSRKEFIMSAARDHAFIEAKSPSGLSRTTTELPALVRHSR